MSTTVPPPLRVDNVMNRPVPCMSGHAGSAVAACLPARTAATGSGGSVPGRAICHNATYRSSLRHMTPFGIPVVPPVYRKTRSSPDGSRAPDARSPVVTIRSYSSPVSTRVCRHGTGTRCTAIRTGAPNSGSYTRNRAPESSSR